MRVFDIYTQVCSLYSLHNVPSIVQKRHDTRDRTNNDAVTIFALLQSVKHVALKILLAPPIGSAHITAHAHAWQRLVRGGRHSIMTESSILLLFCAFVAGSATVVPKERVNYLGPLPRAYGSPVNIDSDMDCAIKITVLAWEYAKKLLPRVSSEVYQSARMYDQGVYYSHLCNNIIQISVDTDGLYTG